MAKIKAFFVNLYHKIVAYWNYSRTIFINVGGAIVLVANELLPDLMGINYDAFFKHEVSVAIGVALNLLNVWLRLLTVAPVGASPDAKIAAVNAVADVHAEEAKSVALSPKAD